jgi:hypothetical protein
MAFVKPGFQRVSLLVLQPFSECARQSMKRYHVLRGSFLLQYQCMFLHGRLGHRVLLKVPDFALVMSALSASQSEGRQLG